VVQITTKRFIGKGKYDKKFHILDNRDGIIWRICTWHPVQYGLIIGKEVTCQNCQLRQYDDSWELPNKNVREALPLLHKPSPL